MAALLGSAVLGIVFVVMRKYALKPAWPTVVYAIIFTAILFLTRTGTVSNAAGGFAAVFLGYAFLYLAERIISDIGKWALVLAIFLAPTLSVVIANKVSVVLDAAESALGQP